MSAGTSGWVAHCIDLGQRQRQERVRSRLDEEGSNDEEVGPDDDEVEIVCEPPRAVPRHAGENDEIGRLRPIQSACNRRAAPLISDEDSVPDQACVLKVRMPWHDLILNGEKTWEIRRRSSACERS